MMRSETVLGQVDAVETEAIEVRNRKCAGFRIKFLTPGGVHSVACYPGGDNAETVLNFAQDALRVWAEVTREQ